MTYLPINSAPDCTLAEDRRTLLERLDAPLCVSDRKLPYVEDSLEEVVGARIVPPDGSTRINNCRWPT